MGGAWSGLLPGYIPAAPWGGAGGLASGSQGACSGRVFKRGRGLAQAVAFSEDLREGPSG